MSDSNFGCCFVVSEGALECQDGAGQSSVTGNNRCVPRIENCALRLAHLVRRRKMTSILVFFAPALCVIAESRFLFFAERLLEVKGGREGLSYQVLTCHISSFSFFFIVEEFSTLCDFFSFRLGNQCFLLLTPFVYCLVLSSSARQSPCGSPIVEPFFPIVSQGPSEYDSWNSMETTQDPEINLFHGIRTGLLGPRP
jgi:hypothetical protein